jgi:ribonucleoside-diphosphate reductase alpha chain
MGIKKIKKRDGRIVDFDQSRITSAVHKALFDAGIADGRSAKKVSDKVVKVLEEKFAKAIPSVENIQDCVELALSKWNKRAAGVYAEYRQKMAGIREAMAEFGIEEKLTYNAMAVLERRYLLRDETGKIIETPGRLFQRVAKAIAAPESLYGGDVKKTEKEFFDLMSKLEFLPNSPTLFNAGAPLKQLSACFVIPIEDSLESIFSAVKQAAKIEQSGGGVGFSFSRLRPKGDIVKSTMGVASGPVSFMRVFDAATDVIKAGGKRRGAMMGVLRVNHPDITEFITAKQKPGILSNFNVSAAVTDSFMKDVKNNKDYWLINPRTNKRVKEISARKVWDLIIESAWKTGDPGVIFIDEINRKNPTKHIGLIETTNPCVTSDTWTMTSDGPRQIKDIIGEKSEVLVNGKKWHNFGDGFFYTGIKPVSRLETKEGFFLELTDNHLVRTVKKLTRYNIDYEWKEVKKLKPGDKIILNKHKNIEWKGSSNKKEGYLIGLLIGDGMISNNKVILASWGESKGEKKIREFVEKHIKECPHRCDFKGWRLRDNRYLITTAYLKKIVKKFGIDKQKRITPEIERASSAFYKGFLRGFFDADGSVQGMQKKGISIRLAQSDLDRLKAVQRMLLRVGIFSRIYTNRREAGKKKLPDGKGSYQFYNIMPQHELIISNENVFEFYKKIGFENLDKLTKLKGLLKKYKRKLNRERFTATVKKLTSVGIKKVYDIQIPGINAFDANGIIVHNCGEVCLHPYESCNLGSINLVKMLKKKNNSYSIDFDKLRRTVRSAVRFLDDVIDANVYPLPEIERTTKANRRIGLGVMGFADMLILLGIPYNSDKALKIAEDIMKFIADESHKISGELGVARGSFPNFKGSSWDKAGCKAMRNATTTVIAPTGTLSIIAGISSGIEPLFAITFVRKVLAGRRLLEVNRIFEQIAKEKGFYSAELMMKIAKKGSVKSVREVPDMLQKLFVTALEIKPGWHVKMQAVFQKYTDNSVSKTINFPKNAAIADVKKAYELAYRLKCKGITIYRYGSKPEQVLYIGKKELLHAEAEYAGGCPTPACPMPS